MGKNNSDFRDAVSAEEIKRMLEGVTASLSKANTDREQAMGVIGERLASLEANVGTTAVDVNSLCRLVRDGNGQPSMVHRLATLESQAVTLVDELEEMGQHFNSIQSSKMLSRTQLIVGVTGMSVTALLSAIGIAIGLWK